MNTRFNPTANGPLHIGHVYMALLNEAMAHDSGGEFTLRIEDNQLRYGSVENMHKLGIAQHQDLEWMGVQIDHVSYHSEREEDVDRFLEQAHVAANPYISDETHPVIRGVAIEPWPLSARITVEKVVLDYWDGITDMARGLELMQEHQLYMYICDILAFPFPKSYYMPRLMVVGDTEISKTIGNWKIKDLRRAGATPKRIRHILRNSCLTNPDGPWSVDNVKDLPRLSDFTFYRQ